MLTRVLHTGPGRVGVSEERAVAIGRPKVDFEPQGHTIRLTRRGIPPHPYWAISFWTRRPDGDYDRVTVVLIDADTGRVDQVIRAS